MKNPYIIDLPPESTLNTRMSWSFDLCQATSPLALHYDYNNENVTDRAAHASIEMHQRASNLGFGIGNAARMLAETVYNGLTGRWFSAAKVKVIDSKPSPAESNIPPADNEANTPKPYDMLYVVGPGMAAWHLDRIRHAYESSGYHYKIIGNGVDDVPEEALWDIRGLVDGHTQLNMMGHGRATEDGHHLIKIHNYTTYTDTMMYSFYRSGMSDISGDIDASGIIDAYIGSCMVSALNARDIPLKMQVTTYADKKYESITEHDTERAVETIRAYPSTMAENYARGLINSPETTAYYHNRKSFSTLPVGYLSLSSENIATNIWSKIQKFTQYAYDNALPGAKKLLWQNTVRVISDDDIERYRKKDFNIRVHHSDDESVAEITRVLKARLINPNNTAYFKHNPLTLSKTASMLKVLLDAGIDPDMPDNSGRALHHFSTRGDKEKVALLVAAGANANLPNEWGSLPIHVAINGGHDSVVEVLANVTDLSGRKGADVLYYALHTQNTLSVEHIISTKMDVNQMTAFKCRPLYVALEKQHTGLARQVLQAGADPMLAVVGISRALDYVAEKGTKEMAQLLVDFGADPTAESRYGITSIRIATAHGRADMADFLKNAVTSHASSKEAISHHHADDAEEKQTSAEPLDAISSSWRISVRDVSPKTVSVRKN